MSELSTAQMIEQLVVRSMRAAGTSPPAVEIAAAAAQCAPEFDRLWDAGRAPAIDVDLDAAGKLIITVKATR
jgi:hypothetical protein